MASDEFQGISVTPAPEPEQQQAVAPVTSDRRDEFSGIIGATAAAKAKAAGTTAAPDDAGQTLSTAVRTGSSPAVIKADPAAFQRTQDAQQASAAIDSDADLAHFVNTVPDAAAISSGDWTTLGNIASHAAQVGIDTVDQFIYNHIFTPAFEYGREGFEAIKQGRRLPDYDPSDPYSAAKALSSIRGSGRGLAGLGSILAAPEAPAIEAYVNGLEALGIPRDQAYLSLMLAVPRVPGTEVALPGQSMEKPTIRDAPTGREKLENIAGYYKEFEPEQIKTWSDDELKKYVNTKLGMGSAASDLAEVQTPKPGADKGFDQLHVEQSDVDKDTIGRLLQAVQESKTKERSPEAMEAWLNIKGLGEKDVLLPSDMISEQYGGITPHPDDRKFGWIDDINNRLPDATELGSEISVPLSKFLANVDPAALGDIKDFVRFGDNGMSPIEADQWIENYHERFIEDAQKDDVANMAVPEEERTPSRAGPQEWGVENFLPMREDFKVKPGANLGRLMKMTGAHLYGEPTNMDKVSVKELLQNSYDAIKGAIEQGTLGPEGGKILLNFDYKNRVITMLDNGTGMTSNVLGTKFLEIAGTQKETTQASGGFGIAKMLFLVSNKGLNVVTMRDGKVSELNTHGEEFAAAMMDPEAANIRVKVRAPTENDRKMFPEGHGTHVEITIPEKYMDTQTGEEKRISFDNHHEYHPVLTRSPLFGNLSVAVNHPYEKGKLIPLNVGRAWPADAYTQFPPAEFKWGTAQIYVSKEKRPDNESWQENVHFLSNGIWQFSKNLKTNPMDFGSENIPHNFYIDIHPKVAPEEGGYPFDLNRQGLTKAAKDSFEQVLNYLSKTYQQLDFLSQAKSYGDIQYLTPGKGGVEVSARTKLEPKIPPSKTSMTGLGPNDKIEFKGDSMYVNGKKMPSLKKEDLGKATIKIEELMVDRKLIDPNKVMLHSSMETLTEVVDKEATDALRAIEKALRDEGAESDADKEFYKLDKEFSDWATKNGLPKDDIDELLARDDLSDSQRSYLQDLRRRFNRNLYDEMVIPKEGEGVWKPLDEVAREKFGQKFDTFMFGVGTVFMRLRNFIATLPGYKGLMEEGIGISFDTEYRGVSIRVPFAASFINPALPIVGADKPILAAAGTWGTMVHELTHHIVRSHGVEFEAEMARLDAILNAEKIKILRAVATSGYNPQGAINALAKIYEEHTEVFAWLRKTILDESKTRTRGRRIKGAGEERGPGGVEGGAEGARPTAQSTVPTGEGVEGRPAQSADIDTPGNGNRGFSINPTEQLAQILLHAEKKSLYLAPLFRDVKSAGMTQKLWTAYAQALQGADEANYEKALAAAHKEVQKTLEPAYKAEFNRIREEVESDFRSANDIAANNYFRLGKLPTGETQSPLKLDRTAVEYMGGKGALKDITTAKGGVHPDDVAPTFGYQSGRELVQGLTGFDTARGRKTTESYINQLIDEETNKRMAEKHGDLRERIAERAQEIALENHNVDILIMELKQLAKTSGQIPFTFDQISRRVQRLFERVPYKEAKYQTYQKAVFKAGVKAEEYLLGGKIDKAFKAKQTQIYAVLAAKMARSFESYKKSQENTFKRVANNTQLSGVEQRYKDFASDILAGMGYSRAYNHPDHGSFTDFIAEHNGNIAAAYWIVDPTQIRRLPNGAAITYKDMNVEEFTGLAKTIQSILHVGREEKKINTAYGKANVENALLDLTNQMKRWPDIPQPKGVFGVRGGWNGIRRWVGASHMLVERMFDYADQFNPKGPFSTYIDRPMRESYNEEIKLQEATVKKLLYIRDKYVDSSIYDKIDNREIMDPLVPGQPMQLIRWNLRKIIGHAGSESGFGKVVNGHKITEDQLYALIVRNATKQDIEYANLMWELHNDLWARAAKKYEARTGIAPDAIEARPLDIKLASGETVHATGGYEPIVHDQELGSIAQDLSLKGDPFEPGYVSALPPNKYQVPRTKYYGPIDFTGSMEASRIAGMIHDIAFRDVVLQTRKLLMSKEATKAGGFRETSKLKWGISFDQLYDGWLKDIANSHLIEDDFMRGASRALTLIRQGVVNSLIFLKPTVAVKHGLTALGMSTAQVGPVRMASGLYDVGGSAMVGAIKDMIAEHGMEPDAGFAAAFKNISKPGKRGSAMRQFIYNSSPMMRARRRQQRNTIRGAMDALRIAGWRKGLVDVRQYSMATGRTAVAVADSLSADAEWLAAYNKNFSETGDHDESVIVADRAVTRAHGSNFVGDRSALMRSRNEWIRNTALLFTYWNHFTVNMQQLRWDMKARLRGEDEPGATIPSISARMAYYFLLAVIADTLAETIFTHDKRPLWLRGLRATVRQIGTANYFTRDATNAMLGYEPSAGAIGLAFSNFSQIVKDAAQGRPSRDWLRHITGAIGMLGFGGDQLGSTVTGVANALTGEENPEDVPEAIKQLATGHPRPAR